MSEKTVLSEKELEDVMRLWFHGNIQAHDFISKDYWVSNYEAVKEMMPQAKLLIWKSENQITGFMGLLENYVAGIFVDETFRSQGIGKQLLDKGKAIRDELALHVYAKNESALRFYRREGFQVCKKQTDEETGETEYLMKWRKEEEKTEKVLS